MRALLEHEVLLVTGKGGVGKSVVAAAAARRAATQGKRVLLLEFEEVSRAAPLFGRAGAPEEPEQVAPGLWLMGFDLMHSLRSFALDQLRLKPLVDLALRNDSVRGFFLAMPAIKSILFLYKLYQLRRDGERFDLIVCDLPTSGFVAGLYGVPLMLGQIFRIGPLAETVREMADLLQRDGRAGLVLVTLAEEMPVVETIELAKDLEERHGRKVAAVVVNGLYARALSDPQWAALAPLRGSQDRGTEALLWAADVIQRRARRAEGLLEQLRGSLKTAPLLLPHLFKRNLTLEDIDQLAEQLPA